MLFLVFLKQGKFPPGPRVIMIQGAALVFCLLLSCAAQAEAPVHAAHHRQEPKPETDFDCAVHTAYGEARNTSREEEAVVINLLVERAHMENLSICQTAHKFFKPRKGSTRGILAAAKNVLQGDKSMVPPEFLHATEMRAYGAPEPPADKFRRLGSVDKKCGNGMHGNVFYERIDN